jgi:TatD DNase family protein
MSINILALADNHMIADSHAHYDHKRFKEDADTFIPALPSNGIGLVINVGCDLFTSNASIKLAKKYPHVYATVGVHPHSAKSLNEENLQKLKELATTNEKVVAIGETGLDFFHDFSPRDVQREWFKRQLELAHELDLPVVIHSREANQEVFDTILYSDVRKGVIHSFSGDWKLALRYVELGFHIGISGVVTFDKTNQLQSAVKEIPLDRILMETDCPYLTPAPHRSKRNDSTMLSYVAEAIAQIKGTTVETVCTQTMQNVGSLFGL